MSQKGLIIGIANDQSIASGCAEALYAAGADLALTYLNEKAKSFVAPVAEKVAPSIFMPLDVTKQDQQDALFAAIAEKWGALDFLIHIDCFCAEGRSAGRYRR